jgi:hypothetical protein
LSVAYVDYPALADIAVRKFSSSTGAAVPGATYDLYVELPGPPTPAPTPPSDAEIFANYRFEQRGVTDQTGHLTFTVRQGYVWCVHEVSAPPGYVLDPGLHCTGSVSTPHAAIELAEVPSLVTITVHKFTVDDPSAGVPHALYALFVKDPFPTGYEPAPAPSNLAVPAGHQLWAIGETNAQGQLAFTVPSGHSWCVQELRAPPGYGLDPALHCTGAGDREHAGRGADHCRGRILGLHRTEPRQLVPRRRAARERRVAAVDQSRTTRRQASAPLLTTLRDVARRNPLERLPQAVAEAVVAKIVEALDVDSIVKRIDVDDIVKRMDVNDIVDRVDVNALMDRVDVDALVARVDVDAIAERIDVDALAERLDVDRLVERTELGTILARSTTGILGEFLNLLRRQAVSLDDLADRVSRWRSRFGEPTSPSPALENPKDSRQGHYAGAISRLLAIVADSFFAWWLFLLAVAATQATASIVLRHAPNLFRHSWLTVGVAIPFFFIYFSWQWLRWANVGNGRCRPAGRHRVGWAPRRDSEPCDGL